MSEPLPSPPISADIQVPDSFLFDTVRFLGSELVALATGEELRAALILWCRAWQQRPAGSLPGNDQVLASYVGRTLTQFLKIRDMATRHFVRHNDGRLYHQVLVTDALRARKAIDQRKGAAEAARLAREEKKAREAAEMAAKAVPGQSPGTPAGLSADMPPGGSPGQSPGVPLHFTTLHSSKEETPPPSVATPLEASEDLLATPKFLKAENREDIPNGRNPRGSRLPADWQPDDADRDYAVDLGLDLARTTADFRDYWHAKAGRDATKLDWPATWRKWCRRAADERGRSNGNGSKPASTFAAGRRVMARLTGGSAGDLGTSGERLPDDAETQPAGE